MERILALYTPLSSKSCPAWIRTRVSGFKVRCATAAPPGIKRTEARQGDMPRLIMPQRTNPRNRPTMAIKGFQVRLGRTIKASPQWAITVTSHRATPELGKRFGMSSWDLGLLCPMGVRTKDPKHGTHPLHGLHGLRYRQVVSVPVNVYKKNILA